jgi:hypothetical protein
MMILFGLGMSESFALLWSGQIWGFRIWALQRLISIDCASGDVRWALLALVLRWFVAMERFGQARSIGSGRNVADRLGRVSRFRGCHVRC